MEYRQQCRTQGWAGHRGSYKSVRPGQRSQLGEDSNRTGQNEPILINVSLASLTAAVNQWNADCAAGKGDTVFGRTAATMLPIATPPFYTLAQWPGGPDAQGGPIRNTKAQVCDPLGDPIPRLYSNGECGSIWGFLYASGGGDIGELVAFGQIAGNNACREPLVLAPA